ncbi:MAG: hypothetical protein FWD83_07640 [Promicromonosporaceae bacterium]|nr:hypothetical protein [Promicromonosporaceae bacterium]
MSKEVAIVNDLNSAAANAKVLKILGLVLWFMAGLVLFNGCALSGHAASPNANTVQQVWNLMRAAIFTAVISGMVATVMLAAARIAKASSQVKRTLACSCPIDDRGENTHSPDYPQNSQAIPLLRADTHVTGARRILKLIESAMWFTAVLALFIGHGIGFAAVSHLPRNGDRIKHANYHWRVALLTTVIAGCLGMILRAIIRATEMPLQVIEGPVCPVCNPYQTDDIYSSQLTHCVTPSDAAGTVTKPSTPNRPATSQTDDGTANPQRSSPTNADEDEELRYE